MRRAGFVILFAFCAALAACGGGGGGGTTPNVGAPANPQNPGTSPSPGTPRVTPSPGPTPSNGGSPAPTGTFAEYPLPTATYGVYGLTVGPDGNVWFTQSANVGYITSSGSVTTYDETPLAQGTPGPTVGNIARGSGSTLWFQYRYDQVQNGTVEPAWNNYVYQISTSGTIENSINQTSCGMPAHCLTTSIVEPGSQNDVLLGAVDSTDVNSAIYDLTSAGNLVTLDHTGFTGLAQYVDMLEVGNQIWVAGPPSQGFGVVTPGSAMTVYPWPSGFAPSNALGTSQALAAGPDGVPWVTLNNSTSSSTAGECALGRISGGTVTVFPVATTTDCGLAGITTGPDGALWFTEAHTNKLGRMTTTGTVTEYPVPTASAGLGRIVSASGGLWFTEENANKIGRFTP